MTRPTRLEVNCTTGEQSIIELTDAEIAQIEIDQKAWEAEQAAREVEAQAKAEIRASALAKLTALGLTEDEAKAITG
jgi:hypothetical protein